MSSAGMKVAVAGAFLFGAVLGCAVPREPADFVEGFSECSLIPRRTTCRCDGKLEAATPEDNKHEICGRIEMICVGHTFDCKTT